MRNLLGSILFGLLLLSLFLGLDVWLGYRKMVNGNSAEQVAGVHQPHSNLGWEPMPGTGRHERAGDFSVRYSVDPDGLRHVPNQGEVRSRLWLFGDSFTFGHGVQDDEAWPSVMAREFLAPGLHVRNAGVMGYGLAQQVQRLLELEGEIQAGDRVVFAPVAVDLERSLKHFGHPSKYLFREEKGRVEGYPDLVDGRLVTARFDTPAQRLRALLYNARYTGRGLQRLHHWLAPPAALEEARRLMEIARAVAEGRGARFAWLLLPQPRECLTDGYRVELSGLDFPDLKPFFPGDAEGVAAIQFPNDPHWNARGHEMAARAVSATLLEQGVLTPEELITDPALAKRSEP